MPPPATRHTNRSGSSDESRTAFQASTLLTPQLPQRTQHRREASPERDLSSREPQNISVRSRAQSDEGDGVGSLIANSSGSTPARPNCKRPRSRCDTGDGGTTSTLFNPLDIQADTLSEDVVFHQTPKVRATSPRKAFETGGDFRTSRLLEAERRAKETIQLLRVEAEGAILEKDFEIKHLKKDLEGLRKQVEGLQTQLEEIREERDDLLVAKDTLANKVWQEIEEKRLNEKRIDEACKLEEEETTTPTFLTPPEDVITGVELVEVPPLLVEGDRLQIGELVIRCGQLLGIGGQGKVIAGSTIRGKEHSNVALKQMAKYNNPELDESFFREVRALHALHPLGLCPRFVGALETSKCFIVVMAKEVTSLWDLQQHLVVTPRYQDGLPIPMVRKMAHELVLLIAKLHQLGWVHRDIKPPNILVTTKGRLVLSDMGVTGLESSDLNGYCGTLGFTAPEVTNRKVRKASRAVDMWALGCTILWIMGIELGQKTNRATSIDKTRGEGVPQGRSPGSARFSGFSMQCLRHKASGRLTAEQAVDHPWFAGLPRKLPEQGPWLDDITSIPKNLSLEEHEKTYFLELGRGPARELLVRSTARATDSQ
ncbi:CBL-interacting serine/threonine-protein kinase 4 [Serendipita sp. 399]|nr:CBL-interacting serine/threonine-protein kinase 4 [Serendipita sp. 399]